MLSIKLHIFIVLKHWTISLKCITIPKNAHFWHTVCQQFTVASFSVTESTFADSFVAPMSNSAVNELVRAFSKIHQIHSIYDANESKKCRREVWQHHDRLLLNNNDWDGSRLSQQCQYVVGCWWLQTSQWHHPTTLKNNSAWITLQVPCTKSPSVSCIISYTFHLVD